MKTLCRNVRGLGNSRSFRACRDIISHFDPHILFLSETKCNVTVMNKLNATFNYYGCFPVSSSGAKGVICLFWKENVQVKIRSFSFAHMDAMVSWEGVTWRFMGIYGQPVSQERRFTWDLIRRLDDSSGMAWVIGGDFNEILWDHEK